MWRLWLIKTSSSKGWIPRKRQVSECHPPRESRLRPKPPGNTKEVVKACRVRSSWLKEWRCLRPPLTTPMSSSLSIKTTIQGIHWAHNTNHIETNLFLSLSLLNIQLGIQTLKLLSLILHKESKQRVTRKHYRLNWSQYSLISIKIVSKFSKVQSSLSILTGILRTNNVSRILWQETLVKTEAQGVVFNSHC